MSFSQYSKDIHVKANTVGRDLLDFMARSKEVMVPDLLDPEQAEEQKLIQEKTLDFSASIIEYLATQDIPAHYATLGIEKLIDGLNALKQYINGTINSYNDEYLSRMYGFKNDDGKYRMEVATVGQLLLKLKEARDATGGNLGDFFNGLPVTGEEAEAKPADEPVDGSIPSPFKPE